MKRFYHVKWEMGLEAETASEARELAQTIIKDQVENQIIIKVKPMVEPSKPNS